MDIVQVGKTSVAMTFLKCNFQVAVVGTGLVFQHLEYEGRKTGDSNPARIV